MSGTKKTENTKVPNVTISQHKLNHVRKLNFGQSILDLNVVNRVEEQKGNYLVIDNNVTRIPCTEKAEFVRKWVETHGEHTFATHEESYSQQTSPILGSSTTKRAKGSPVYGHRRKRARGKTSVNNSTIESIDTNSRSTDDRFKERDCAVPVPSYCIYNNFNDDSKENKCNSRTPIRSRILKDENELSPVLVDDHCRIRRKRRKLDDKGKPIALMEYNCTDTNMNSVILSDDKACTMYLGKDCRIVSNERQQMLLKSLEMNNSIEKVEFEVKEEVKNLSSSLASRSPLLKSTSYIADSPGSTEDCIKIEVDSSDEAKDNVFNELETVNSDSDRTQSCIIEDVNTQDEFVVQKPHRSKDSPFPLPSTCQLLSQTLSKDSQESTFSLAKENTVATLIPSEKISDVLTPVTEKTDDQSNETDIISTVTSPQRTNSDSAKYFAILDSCKKRRRVKRGSLSEKLQSLVNRQTSFVRIWRYQMKQDVKDTTTIKYITVCIQKCTTYFNRQFSEGFVIDDEFDLLPRIETKAQLENRFYRPVTILTIPEIAGRLEVRKSQCVVRISPPWEVIEDAKLFLHVMYINKLKSGERVDITRSKIKYEESKEKVLYEFDCPCIQTNALNPACTQRMSRLNVMETLLTR